jgi:hypothetical protein
VVAIGGLRLRVSFRDQKLLSATIYVKTLADDMGRWTFLVDEQGVRESRRFQQLVCDRRRFAWRRLVVLVIAILVPACFGLLVARNLSA